MYHWLATHQFLQVPLQHWLYALLVAAVGYVVVHAGLRRLALRVQDFGVRRKSPLLVTVAAALGRTSHLLVFLLFALVGLHLVAAAMPAHSVPTPDTVHLWLGRLTIVVAGLQFGLWMNTAIGTWVGERGRGAGGIVTNPVVLVMLAWLARILVWATVLLLILGNMGMNVTAFIASLGIGGVAVALGLQNILKDLFASLAIGLDKPFGIGDYIQTDEFQGTVVHVGVKTTRIRSLGGEEISIGNANLLDKTLHNYARMATRRIQFNFSIPLDTSREHVQQVVEILREILGGIDEIQPDRAHFKGFGASSLDFEAIYIVRNPDYGVYMDIQQRINLELMQRLEAIGVGFAVPVQTLRVADAGKHPAQVDIPPSS